MSKITFCIPSKNNLRYLKSSIKSIKENSSYDHDIIVFIDADNDGTEEWLLQNNITYLKNDSNIPKGIAFGYNKCIEIAKTDIVCMFHADMYMAKGFDLGVLKYIKPKSVISGTRIEPPLHPQGLEKIVENFGLYPEDFKEKEFNEFTQNAIIQNKDKITKGIFAPWVIYKEDIVNLGMHDEYFHSYHEDSDIFNRFILSDYDIIQSWEAYVYHLTCRGGQFQDGIEQITKDSSFHEMKNKSARNYLRKWGSWIKNNEYQYPIMSHKYDIGFILNICNTNLLSVYEPWCSNIYIKDEKVKDDYIDLEQKYTLIDLNEKIKIIDKDDYINEILVDIDVTVMDQDTFNTLIQLPDIITDSGGIGTFELGALKINILAMNTFEHSLIHIYNKQ